VNKVDIYLELAINTLHTIDRVEATATLEELLEVFSEFVGQYGFTSIALSQLSNPHIAQDPANQIFITNWSPEWRAQWWENGYYEHDPIVHYLLKTQKSFSWDVAYRHASKLGKKILDESTKFGFTNGITLPISTGVGPLGIVSLGAEEIPFDPKVLAMIQTVSINTYMHVVKLKNLELDYLVGRLTKRETEIMHLVSQGKTNWEIAQILDIAEETIKTNLKNVSQKLNTVNRAHSVSEAIRKGLIIG